ncbi:unnamed protein product [Closterium sp. Yama58-4]|nr:unnamed protein product [Closterium sp. Yama58-4]
MFYASWFRHRAVRYSPVVVRSGGRRQRPDMFLYRCKQCYFEEVNKLAMPLHWYQHLFCHWQSDRREL